MEQVAVIILSIIIILIPIVIVIKKSADSYYECGNCHHKFVPNYRNVILSLHRDTERKLKCPYCNKKSWCKKTLVK